MVGLTMAQLINHLSPLEVEGSLPCSQKPDNVPSNNKINPVYTNVWHFFGIKSNVILQYNYSAFKFSD
jgi:hypothetical protein